MRVIQLVITIALLSYQESSGVAALSSPLRGAERRAKSGKTTKKKGNSEEATKAPITNAPTSKATTPPATKAPTGGATTKAPTGGATTEIPTGGATRQSSPCGDQGAQCTLSNECCPWLDCISGQCSSPY
eukprot:scaffold753_cov199-Alexandrium_tamarense.AAC.19